MDPTVPQNVRFQRFLYAKYKDFLENRNVFTALNKKKDYTDLLDKALKLLSANVNIQPTSFYKKLEIALENLREKYEEVMKRIEERVVDDPDDEPGPPSKCQESVRLALEAVKESEQGPSSSSRLNVPEQFNPMSVNPQLPPLDFNMCQQILASMYINAQLNAAMMNPAIVNQMQAFSQMTSPLFPNPNFMAVAAAAYAQSQPTNINYFNGNQMNRFGQQYNNLQHHQQNQHPQFQQFNQPSRNNHNQRQSNSMISENSHQQGTSRDVDFERRKSRNNQQDQNKRKTPAKCRSPPANMNRTMNKNQWGIQKPPMKPPNLVSAMKNVGITKAKAATPKIVVPVSIIKKQPNLIKKTVSFDLPPDHNDDRPRSSMISNQMGSSDSSSDSDYNPGPKKKCTVKNLKKKFSLFNQSSTSGLAIVDVTSNYSIRKLRNRSPPPPCDANNNDNDNDNDSDEKQELHLPVVIKGEPVEPPPPEPLTNDTQQQDELIVEEEFVVKPERCDTESKLFLTNLVNQQAMMEVDEEVLVPYEPRINVNSTAVVKSENVG